MESKNKHNEVSATSTPVEMSVTVRQCDAGPVEDGLSQQVVAALKGAGRGPQRVPDLLPALERWRRIPELISLAAQLALSHRVVTFPFRPLSLQGLVTS